MSYSVGENVNGIVSGVTDYGAFVRLADGTGGMIHISKLSRGFVSNIHEFIKKGDEVTATVISEKDGKLALSLIGDEAQNKNPPDFESMLATFKSVSDEKMAKIQSRNKRKK